MASKKHANELQKPLKVLYSRRCSGFRRFWQDRPENPKKVNKMLPKARQVAHLRLQVRHVGHMLAQSWPTQRRDWSRVRGTLRRVRGTSRRVSTRYPMPSISPTYPTPPIYPGHSIYLKHLTYISYTSCLYIIKGKITKNCPGTMRLNDFE